jgi:hypothetical protein
MSKLLGGLFSRPSGKASGLVFGAGRTKRGKQVTAREYTIPTDPKTNAQLAQRSKMPYVTQIIQGFGRAIYQFDWNRAVKNLPGFQSLSSVLMPGMAANGQYEFAPPSTTLGTRHFPDTYAAVDADPDVTLNWSTETGDIGAADDEAIILMFDPSAQAAPEDRAVAVNTGAVRSDGTVTISNAIAAGAGGIYGLYFKAAGSGIPSRDKLSECQWIPFER